MKQTLSQPLCGAFVFALFLLLAASFAHAQGGGPGLSNYPATISTGSGAPSVNCPGLNAFYVDSLNSNLYFCPAVGAAYVKAGGSSSGTVVGSNLTAGYPSYGTGGVNISVGASFIDANVASSTANGCAKINAVETLVAATGTLIDARGITGPTTNCNTVPMFPSGSVSDVLLGPITYQVHQTVCVPGSIYLTGVGWNSSTGTVLQATTDLALGGAATGPVLGWGVTGTSTTGWCPGKATVIQNALVQNIVIDGNNIDGAVTVQALNAQEGSGCVQCKMINFGGGAANVNGGEGLQISGPNLSLTVTTTTSSTSFTVTGGSPVAYLLPAWVGVPVTIGGSMTACGGNECVIASVSNGGGCSVAASTNCVTGTFTAAITTGATGQTMLPLNSTAQNSEFKGLDIGLPSSTSTCPTSPSVKPVGIVENNGGAAAGEGPRAIEDATIVVQGTTCIGDSPYGMETNTKGQLIWNIHFEGWSTAGLILGQDSNTQGVEADNIHCLNMSTSTACVMISNVNTTNYVSLRNIVTYGGAPTDVILDQVAGNTIAVASESQVALYIIGASSNSVLTTATSVANRIPLLTVNGFPQNFGSALPTDSGAVNVMVVALPNAPTSYAAGFTACFLPGHANTSTTPTVAFNTAGAKTIVKITATALAVNDMITTEPACVTYDGVNMLLLDPQAVTGTGAQVLASSPKFGSGFSITNLLCSGTAPTVASGGGGTAAATIVNSNGCSFSINVGTGTITNPLVLTFPAAAHGWAVHCDDITTTSATNFITKQTGAVSTTSVTLTAYTDAALTAGTWTASDILECVAGAN